MTKIPDTPGVYCLKTLHSKLIYIGSSKQLWTRAKLHRSAFKKNDSSHGCAQLMKAYNDGEQIDFDILELCGNYVEREQYWIDFYRTQQVYTVINVFAADRNGSTVPDTFRDKMSELRIQKWKDPVYRANTLRTLAKTQFTAEQVAKHIHVFVDNVYVDCWKGAAKVQEHFPSYGIVSISAAARGSFAGKWFRYKGMIFIYDEVLDKLDELLETHQELRAISSQDWRACLESSSKVQRLTSEQCSNNLDKSVQHAQ